MSLAVGKRRASIDWIVFSIYIALLLIGCLMVFSAGYSDQNPKSIFDLSTTAGRQVMWVLVSLTIFIFVQIIDERFWRTFAFPIYLFSVFLLLMVLILGSTIKGQTAWFSFAGFTFQPSELAKFGTCLALSSFLGSNNNKINERRTFLVALGIIATPVFLIMLQPDAGSALVFLTLLIVLYRNGASQLFFIVLLFSAAFLVLGLALSLSALAMLMLTVTSLILVLLFREKLYYGAVLLVVAVGSVITYYQGHNLIAILIMTGFLGLLLILLWKEGKTRIVSIVTAMIILGGIIAGSANYFFNNILKPHQQDRINVWLHPERCDPRGSLYNVLQSKMAIGAGGFAGKGFLEGNMTKLNYVPEQNTDFIFCTVGEEQGFIGAAAVILLYCILLMRLVQVAERQKLPFKRHFIYGVLGIFFTHFFINIGMTVGLMPVIGIPLPFMSYGGSSMIGFTLLLATVIKFDSDKTILG